MIQKRVSIVFNHHLAGASHAMGFECPEIAAQAAPGTFVMLREAQPRGYLLNRPFSIGNVDGNTIEIYYDTVGKATHAFAALHQGDELDVFGPLGTGFSVEPDAALRLLVAGGIGIAPFPFLAIELAKHRHGARTVVLAGYRASSHVILQKLFEQIGVAYEVATEDGSRGFKGFVTGLLEQKLGDASHRGDASRRLDEASGFVGLDTSVAVYACGPTPMLKRVAEITAARELFCELSLEQYMACGVGACLVCACRVRTPDGGGTYKMVCKDGPVFNAREVLFE
jgi:dihydroorotate dehydrogenase electron transfer subunit